MEFVQVIEYQTSKPDEMAALAEEFLAQRAEDGGPAPSMVLVVGDRNRPNTYLTIVRFPSYEAAMENSQRDDTTDGRAVCRPLRQFADLPEPRCGGGGRSLPRLTG